MRFGFVATLAALSALSACGTDGSDGSAASAGDTGLDRLERLTLNADRCWFDSGDPVFADYSLAPELSSFSGRPRFLIVPEGQPEARPLLVVEGFSGSSEILTYGPLLGEDIGRRIEADLNRWKAGSNACA